MDAVYRCFRCGKLVFEYNLLYDPHCCTKCGGRRVIPAIQDLTRFGKWYCDKKNKIGLHFKKKNENIENIGF